MAASYWIASCAYISSNHAFPSHSSTHCLLPTLQKGATTPPPLEIFTLKAATAMTAITLKNPLYLLWLIPRCKGYTFNFNQENLMTRFTLCFMSISISFGFMEKHIWNFKIRSDERFSIWFCSLHWGNCQNVTALAEQIKLKISLKEVWKMEEENTMLNSKQDLHFVFGIPLIHDIYAILAILPSII